MKSLFFEVDYNAFISGTVIHSKDLGRDNITNNDNASSSLTMVGPDGLYQKEKINRFGNKGYVFTARHASIDDLQSLGSVYSNDDIDDVVIYHREYSICDNVVIATYYGMHDYVLKNYFTSVYAKHRPYSLMSYSESIRRSENDKTLLVLSKNKVLYEILLSGADFFIDKLFSFYKKSLEDEQTGNYLTPDKINYAYITHGDDYYATDVNAFVSGNSLCFNMSMYDNASMGVYIKNAVPNFNIAEGTILDWEDTTKDVTGSVQDWYMSVDDEDTGFVNEMGFYLCHLEKDKIFSDKILDFSNDLVSEIIFTERCDVEIIDEEKMIKELLKHESSDQTYEFVSNSEKWQCVQMPFESSYFYTNKQLEDILGIRIKNQLYPSRFDVKISKGETSIEIKKAIEKLIKLPKITEEVTKNATNIIGNKFYIYKDNKEIIDMTYQYEPITIDKNVMFSSLLMNLSDLVSSTSKRSQDVFRTSITFDGENMNLYSAMSRMPVFVLEIPKKIINNINDYDKKISGEFLADYDQKTYGPMENNTSKNVIFKFGMQFNNASIIDSQEIDFVYRQRILTCRNIGYWLFPKYSIEEVINDDMHFKLKRIDANNRPYNGSIIFPDEDNCYYYTNYNFANNSVLSGYENEFIDISGKTRKVSDIGPGGIPTYADFGKWTMIDGLLKITDMKNHKILMNTDNVEVKDVDEKNMYVVLSDKNLNKSVVYDEFKAEEKVENINGFEKKVYSSPHLNIVERPVLMFFRYETDENEIPYIRVELSRNRVGEETKSVQYWFRDDESGSFKFVFGVNLTDEDYDRGYVKIYISAVKSRDERVFDDKFEVVGNVVNFIDNNNEKTYGKDQYYCDIIE